MIRHATNLIFSLVLLGGTLLASEPERPLTFEEDIRPIFRAHCFDCHGATDEIEGKLDLRLVRFLKKGGESGPAIEPSDPAASYLLERIKSGEMPPDDHRVPDDQIAIVEKWIVAGAQTARPEPASLGRGLGITAEERDYWAFQPITRPSVPEPDEPKQIRTSIDSFLLAKMESKGLKFNPDADKTKLVRRAYLDLIGLPPTPEQVAAYIADERDDAWERLVDELLESPHYGERWARHWLDVAGYADSEGVTNQDTVREWSYKYRDWVIRSLNKDMPFDQFIVWQLAGDELAKRPFKNMSAETIDRLTATGFLRMAADGTGTKNDETNRDQVVTDTIKIVSTSLLGMSVACAQCHDHRYDPISQEDYFRLRAVFKPALNYQAWKRPTDRRISLYSPDEIAQSAKIEVEAQKLVEARNEQQTEYMESVLEEELQRIKKSVEPETDASALVASLDEAWHAAAGERSEQQNALLDKYPPIKRLTHGTLYQYNQGHADKLKEHDKKISDLRATKPQEHFVRALTEPELSGGDQAPVTRLFHRGDYREPKHEVEPGTLTVMSPADAAPTIESNASGLPTTGRRLAYARWLTSGKHPTFARVMVNRIWLHHFGQTFVATPDEFGKLGRMPTHPELIDWLAAEWMEHGWSLKHLHRTIMRSTVYRQNSTRSDDAINADSSNKFYSHFPVRRLEAEVVRDAILDVSGRLDKQQFGPPIPVEPDVKTGLVAEQDRQRRSVYLRVRRTQPVAMLTSFDAPEMETNCGCRQSTTAATQSLLLMNSDFILKFAAAFAERLENDKSLKSVEDRIVYGWQLAYSRRPTADELQFSNEYINEQLDLLKKKKHEKPEQQALTNFCQALLSSNEFLYIE